MLYPIGHELRFDVPAHPGGYELRYSKLGHPFYVWKKCVPRISDQILECVVYLYPSAEHAEAGEAAGGTGFLLREPSKVHEGWSFTYVVTNDHVVRGGATVARFNTGSGATDILPLGEEHWVHHQDGDDLAVCPVTLGPPGYLKYMAAPSSGLLTQENVEESQIGPGDDVYTVGRFVSHEGRQRNTPMTRFGRISMMPGEPIYNPERGISQESFLVEMHSLSGMSGSPVFVNRHPYPAIVPKGGDRYEPTPFTWILGVDWGHFKVYELVKEKNKRDNVPEGWVVEANSGHMMVVPAWKLRELLDQEELVMQREKAEHDLTKQQEASHVALDMRGEDAREEQADADADAPTRADFFRDLKRVAKKQDRPSRPDSETR